MKVIAMARQGFSLIAISRLPLTRWCGKRSLGYFLTVMMLPVTWGADVSGPQQDIRRELLVVEGRYCDVSSFPKPWPQDSELKRCSVTVESNSTPGAGCTCRSERTSTTYGGIVRADPLNGRQAAGKESGARAQNGSGSLATTLRRSSECDVSGAPKTINDWGMESCQVEAGVEGGACTCTSANTGARFPGVIRGRAAGLSAPGQTRQASSPADSRPRIQSQTMRPVQRDFCGGSNLTKYVPDRYWSVNVLLALDSRIDLRLACFRHDGCYGTCGKQKHECDEQFRRNLVQECRSHGGAVHRDCLTVADAYHSAVSLFGSDFYAQGQARACAARR